MPSSVIGALRVSLGLDSAEFATGAAKAEKRADQLATRVASSLRGPIDAAKSLSGAFAALGGAAALGGLTALASRSLDYASSLAEVAQQLGVTTKDLQQYRYAATQVGISQEEVDKGLAKLTVTMGQAREGAKKPVSAFTELSNILGKDILKSASTAGDAIPLIADALNRVQDPARRAALEVAIFGKTGQKLDTLLAGGSDAVNQLRDAASDLGLVLSEEQIANADQTADKLSELKQVLEANIAGAVANNASAIYDFVTALERLIGLVPAALNELGKFRAYLNIASGVLNGDPSELAAAQADLKERQTYGAAGRQRDTFTAGAAQSLEKFRPSRRGAGAGDTGGGSGAGKGKSAGNDAARIARERKRDAEKAQRDERAYQRDLARAQDDELNAQLDLTVDQTERVNIQQQLLDHERDAQVQAINTDEHLKADQKATLAASAQRVYVLKSSLLHREDQEKLAKLALDKAQAQADNETDILEAQGNLARTAKERGEIERQILDKQFEMLKLVQQNALDEAQRRGDKQGIDIATQRLSTLDTLQKLGQARVAKANQGPLASYLDSIPKTAQEVNEAIEGITAGGLSDLIDGLAKTKGSFKDLASVVSSVADQIISSLIKIGLQKGIAALFGSLLGGSGRASPFAADGNPGMSLGFDSSGLDLSGFRAKGGSVIGGRNYVVGEMGPEVFTAPHSGNIIANDNLGGGGSVSVTQNITIPGGVDLMTRTEGYRVAGAVKDATMAAIAEQQRRRP